MRTREFYVNQFDVYSDEIRKDVLAICLEVIIERVKTTGKDIHITFTNKPPKHKADSRDPMFAIMQAKIELNIMTEQDWDNLGEWLQEKFDNLPEDKKLFPEERREKEIAEMWQNVNTK